MKLEVHEWVHRASLNRLKLGHKEEIPKTGAVCSVSTLGPSKRVWIWY